MTTSTMTVRAEAGTDTAPEHKLVSMAQRIAWARTEPERMATGKDGR